MKTSFRSTFIVATLALVFMANSFVFANEDQPAAVCMAEADEINFESQTEKDAFMEECMEQFKQEMSDVGSQSMAANGASAEEQ